MTVDTWTGAGYVILDPNTGAGAYMISGGFAGGGSDVSNIEILGKWLLIAVAILAIVGLLETLEGLISAISVIIIESAIASFFVVPVLLFAVVMTLITIYLIYTYAILPNYSNTYYLRRRINIA